MSTDLAASNEKKSGFRPGFSVKDGKLYAFSKGRVIAIRGWPKMSAWTRTCRQRRWSRIRPKIDFLQWSIRSLERWYPSRADSPPTPSTELDGRDFFEELELVRGFFSNIPLAVTDAIAPFRRSQWHLHVMAGRFSDSLDLIRSNPALAYCLASCWVFAKSPSLCGMRLIRGLIGSRRRDICRALGFPETESSVSVLSKVAVSKCSIPWLLRIRDLLKDSHWRKTLWHLPALNEEVMDFLTCDLMLGRATPRLLHELSENPVSISDVMMDVIIMEYQLGQPGHEPFHSLRQFYRCHAQLLDRIGRAGLPDRNDLNTEPQTPKPEFPKPPILGNENILALESRDLISQEGREQHNCLNEYRCSVSSGTIYFYRVLHPERATLSIFQNQNGQWQVDQLLRARNEPVSDATRQAVLRWLSASR